MCEESGASLSAAASRRRATIIESALKRETRARVSLFLSLSLSLETQVSLEIVESNIIETALCDERPRDIYPLSLSRERESLATTREREREMQEPVEIGKHYRAVNFNLWSYWMMVHGGGPCTSQRLNSRYTMENSA